MNIIQSKTKTILVVDDDPAICDMLTALLGRAEFQVMSTVHPRESLTYFKNGSYLKVDLVITDLQMPGYGGYSLIKDLQQLEEHREVPVIVITGKNLDKETLALIQMESNVKELFKKPFSTTKLVNTIHDLLGTAPVESF